MRRVDEEVVEGESRERVWVYGVGRRARAVCHSVCGGMGWAISGSGAGVWFVGWIDTGRRGAGAGVPAEEGSLISSGGCEAPGAPLRVGAGDLTDPGASGETSSPRDRALILFPNRVNIEAAGPLAVITTLIMGGPIMGPGPGPPEPDPVGRFSNMRRILVYCDIDGLFVFWVVGYVRGGKQT